MSFQIGDTVGTYKIVAAIGSGGMGEVFRVEHVVTNRVEAMKIFSTETVSRQERDQRFLREIQIQARLSHPNIAAVNNAFWENGHLVMIMELIQGSSLRSLLDRGRLPLQASVDYACQVLTALDYAHAHGVVHRDISPANMIISEDGILKLTDFGLAKSLNDIRLTQTGSLIGSLYYTSPEQVRGCANIDARADIYSVGAVLYEMATGVKLFDSDNPYTLMLAHVEQPPSRASEVDSGLPPALDEILLQALQKDPGKRFQSAELFRCALEIVKDFRIGGRIAAPPDGAQMCPLAPAEPDPVTPLAPGPAEKPTPSSGFTTFQSRRVKVAAAVMLILASSVGKTAQSPALRRSGTGAATAPLDFAALPFTWPSNLMLFPEVTYPRPHKASSPRTSAAERNTMNEQGGQPVRKKHNLFMRAMSRVVHPFRGSSENTTAKTFRDSEGN